MTETVFINGRFLGQRTSGVQRYAGETLRALDQLMRERAPHALSLILLAPPNAPDPGLTRIEFRRVGKLTGNAWEQLSLPRAAAGHWLLSFGPTGPLLKRAQLVTIHDAAVYAVPAAYSLAFRAWYKLLLPVLVRRTPRVMTVSEFARGELVRWLGVRPERVDVCGEGWQHVLRSASEPSVLSEHGLITGRYLFAVSNVAPHKNFALLARAAELLGQGGCEIVVAGASNPRLFGRTSPASLRSLRMIGYVDDRKLRALYENAAGFIYPSTYEGFGIPPLEAMALGCPVLASNAAAIPEVCGDGAWYFEPDDAAKLAELMQRLLTRPEQRRELIERGNARLSRFSWTDAARVYLRTLEQLIGAADLTPDVGATEHATL
jgi:glycosyltransferase involved in cell wall biosynthesis